MKKILLSLVLVFLFVSYASAESKYGDGFLGVKFGATLKTVKAEFPDLEADADGTYYTLKPGRAHSIAAVFSFTTDNRLRQISLVFRRGFGDSRTGAVVLEGIRKSFGNTLLFAGPLDAGGMLERAVMSWPEDGGVKVYYGDAMMGDTAVEMLVLEKVTI